MKIAILLETAQGLELDRKEIEVAAVDKVAISAAVDNAVATWRTVGLGVTIRIRAIDERPAPDYDTRRERWYVESALTIVSSSDVPLRERASRLVDLWERLAPEVCAAAKTKRELDLEALTRSYKPLPADQQRKNESRAGRIVRAIVRMFGVKRGRL